MQLKNPYKIFDNYILRTPLFSFSDYKKFTSNPIISDQEFRLLCQNKIFREAIFLATPSFFTEMNKWLDGQIDDKESSDKIKSTILKYYSRMSSRCTPFGLFSGCSVGIFSENTDIELSDITGFKRHTRLDMHYLVALSQDLVKNKKIKSKILFYPNTSTYQAGEKLRYVEYSYVNGTRKHNMISVDNSEYLDFIFEKARKGALLMDLAKELVEDDISLEEALEFVEELADSQLLISELEPSVSGPDFLEQICLVLRKIEDESVQDIYMTLMEVKNRLFLLDSKLGNEIDEYIKISDSLKKLGTKFELNFLFQTDTSITNKKNTINKKLLKDLLQVSELLNKMTFTVPNETFTNFKEAFEKRYETREVPLSKALDIEMGIGYKQNNESGDLNPLIDDLAIVRQSTENNYYNLKWSPINSILQKKLHNNTSVITLRDEDFASINIKWNDLPDTMSTMAELVYIDNEEKVRLGSIGGASATMLLGRFCHANDDIYNVVQQIIDVERKINNNNVSLAEIVHLPKSRSGNVISRPELREYEIPYLARSIKSEEKQLTINDLNLSIDASGNIALKSKKLNKIVKPMMANAHNFEFNSLPIYHFLCDLQFQGLRQGVGIQLGALTNNYEFIPRIEYKNIIIQDATWNLNKAHINKMIIAKKDDTLLTEAVTNFSNKHSLPQFIVFHENDNELIINLKNLNSLRMFLEAVKKLNNFTISEFLFSEKGLVNKNDDYYTNQIIISFYNEKKLINSNG